MHFPAGHPGRTLSVILLYDARTFLAVTAFANIRRDSPARSLNYYTYFFCFVKPFYILLDSAQVK